MADFSPQQRRKAIQDFMRRRGLNVHSWTGKANVADSTLRNFLDGISQSLTDRTLSKLASAAGVTIGDIIGTTAPPADVHVYGYAGAGERIELIDADDLPTIDTIAGPPGMKDPAAVIVRGDSMLPMFHNGDTIFFEKRELQPEAALGRECIVRVKEGPVLVKRLMRGSRKGRYHLVSINPSVSVMEDQPVIWVAKIKWVLRND